MGNCLNDMGVSSTHEENRSLRKDQLVFGEERVKELDTDPHTFAVKGMQWKDLALPASAAVSRLVDKFGLFTGQQQLSEEPRQVYRATSSEYMYVGQMKDRSRHGRGYCLNSRGDLWVASWLDDQADGEGAVYFARGDYFQGKICKGETVSGKLTFANGDVYSGELCRDGCLHGKGELFEAARKTRYRGSWSANLKDGPGELYQEEEWKNGVRIDHRRAEPGLSQPFPAEHQTKATSSK